MAGGSLDVCCECVPVLDAEYSDGGGRTPAEAVVDALAAATGIDPVDLPPLYDSVDPDALDRLFHGGGDGGDSESILAFTVEEWNVFVNGDGRIRVCDATRGTEPAPVFEKAEA